MARDLDDIIQYQIDYLYRNLSNGGRNSVLIRGNYEKSSAILKGAYDLASKTEEFLCTFHNASCIKQPLDFFEPILRLKYGQEYDSVVLPYVKKIISGDYQNESIFDLAKLCARNPKGEGSLAKLPVIFIDSIEELFCKFDFPNLDENIKEQIGQALRKKDKKLMYTALDKLEALGIDAHSEAGFGIRLRSYLHQTNNGIFYGTIKNPICAEAFLTIFNHHYLFYEENFMHIYTADD